MLQYRPLDGMFSIPVGARLMAGWLTLDQLAFILGSRPTAGHIPLEDGILVRIQAPQLKRLLILESFLLRISNSFTENPLSQYQAPAAIRSVQGIAEEYPTKKFTPNKIRGEFTLLTLFKQLVGINYKLDGGSHLVFDRDISEFWHTGNINAVIPEVSGCQHKRLHSLVDGSSTDRLHLGVLMFTDDARNCTCDGRGT
jgi:hypothetical protein